MECSFRKISLILYSGFALWCPQLLFAQSSASDFFIRHGNNFSQVSCGGILYAPIQNQNHQAWGGGSVWLKKQLDLRQPFDISFIVDFIDTTATDGGAFVLQADSAAVGDTYNGLGFRNIKQSVAVTFDAKRTNYDNDPNFDHISIQTNGDTKHGTSNELTPPVTIEPFYSVNYFPPYPPKVVFHHLVTIKWNPASNLLSAYIDHALIISAQNDIIKNIFGGNPMVYWGLTASNTQEEWFPASKEVTFGYFYFFFGDIQPKYTTAPELDTCYDKPIQYFDSSVYSVDSFYNNVQYAKWYWDFGDGQFSNLRFPPAHQYPRPGEYTVKFTVSNDLGCTFDTLVRTIHLGSIPTVDFAIEGAACNNSPIVFTNKSSSAVGPPTVWYWNFDNSAIGRDANPVTTFQQPGFKNISLRVRTFYGCESETTKVIEVGERPVIDFSFQKDCEGTVAFNSKVLNNAKVINWSWLFGDLGYSALPQPTHHYKQNGTYPTSLFAETNTGCVSDSVSKNILINKIYPFAGNDTILSIGEPLPLHATGGELYQWLPSTGLSNSGVANPVVHLNQDQEYILVVRNSDGCEAQDTLRIKVYKGPEVYIPNAFTPNGDGHNDYFRATGPGIKQLDYLRIYDRSGKILFETKNIRNGWDGIYSGQPQPSGTYTWMLSATDFSGTKFFKKGIVVLVR
jgi:gliding motility-associated-like protein